MSQNVEKTAGTDEDVAVRFSYKLFCGVYVAGADGQAVTLNEFKRLCSANLRRYEQRWQYQPEDVRRLVAWFSDGRRFVWRAPLKKSDQWTKAWQQIADAAPWYPTDYGLIPF